MSDSPTFKKEKILVIANNGSLGDRIVDALSVDGYAVFFVKTFADGMKNILDILPHLIILDLDMSEDDAYKILEKKQDEPLLANIPVFLLSTQGGSIDMHRIPAGSVAEFITALDPDQANIVHLVDQQFDHLNEGSNTIGSVNASSATKKKILWAEDDKLISSILGKKLVSSGFDIITTKNGNEALEQLGHITPDLIILDIMLPGMDGFEILQKIRMMTGPLSKVPVMILSNMNKESDIEKAKLLKATKYMVKAASSLDQVVTEIMGMVK